VSETDYYSGQMIETIHSDQGTFPGQGERLRQFMADSLRRCSPMYFVWLIVAILLSSAAYLLRRNSPMGSLWPLQFTYYIIVIVHIVHRIRKGSTANVLGPDIIFVFFYTLFHLGYVTLFTFGVAEYSTYIFHYQYSIPKSLYIINIGLIGFLFGFEIMGLRRRERRIGNLIAPGQAWGVFGIFLMALSIAMHYVGLTFLGFDIILRYGYRAIQYASEYTSYFPALMLSASHSLMVFGLITYLIFSSLRYGKLFKSKIALVLTVVFLATVMLEGDRGPVLMLGIPIILVRHYFIRPIRIRWLAVLFLGALVFFAGTAVVRTIVFQPTKMFEEYKYKKETGEIKWYSTFVEMGGSFMIVDLVAGDVPSVESYWMGDSWVNAALHTVPFLQGFLTRHGMLTRPQPSTWITQTYFGYNAAGRGFTVVAEGYLNFGLPGAFFELMFFGLFIRWLTVKFSRNPSAMWAFIMFGCLGPSIMVIRNHANLATHVYFMVFVMAFILNMLLGNKSYESESEDQVAADGLLYAGGFTRP